MKYVDRECLQCERLLLKARALITRCEYARWQVERLEQCDKQIEALDLARSDYERLKLRYSQARDHHRALRLRLRREYYAHLREEAAPPSAAEGIESKVEELLRTESASRTEVRSMHHTLALVHEAQATVTTQATSYCHAHNALYGVLEESRQHAIELEALAMRMLGQRQRSGITQLTPLGQAWRRNRG